MPANTSSRPVRTVKRVAGLVTVTLMLAAAVLAGVLPAARPQLLPSTAGVVVALFLIVAVAVSRRQRRRRERTQSALAPFEGLHVCSALRDREVRPELRDVEAGPERVLRLQVRALEEALEGQEQRLSDAVRDGHRQALLTLDALRGSVAGESGGVTLDRVEAALRRLGATSSFARPVLGTAATGTVALPAPQPLVTGMVEPAAEPVSEAPTPEAAPETPAGESTVTTEPDTDPTPEQPVVRPVPAFPAREVPHRARRRFRRTVAA